MATKEQLKEIRKKIDYKKNGRIKGSKNKKTLLKEEADLSLRERYINKMLPHLDSITEVHIQEAHNPKNTKERIDALEQLIDKPKQRSEIDVNIERLEELSKSIRKIAEKE